MSGDPSPAARRWYSALLGLYPSQFRRRFGQDMEELFVDQWRADHTRSGPRSSTRLWYRLVRDVVTSALRERLTALREAVIAFAIPQESATTPPLRGEKMFETLRHDLRYTLRMLRKSPTFTVVAVLTIALGSGAVTTIFSAASALILRPLPQVANPAQLVDIARTEKEGSGSMSPSYPFYTHVRDESRAFDGIAAWSLLQITVSTGGQGTATFANMVSANYFTVLGVRPQLGRFFVAEEDRSPGAHPVIVLSDGYWRRRFGADQGIVGRSVMVNGSPYTVVGVAPRSFSGVYPVIRTDAWLPLMMAAQLGRDAQALSSAGAGWLTLFGRLKPGVSMEQARADLVTITKGHLEEEPKDFQRIANVTLSRLTGFPADASAAIFGFIALLLAISALVLAIASVNVAGMLLARATSRKREMAVRVALGAGRRRLIGQLLTESVVLFLAGGLGGVLIALWTTRLFSRIQLPAEVPLVADLSPDLRVLAFAFGTSLITGVVFGIAPALQSTRQDPAAAMRNDTAGAGSRHSWLRNGLVVGQIAVALLLLMSAGLFVRALDRGQRISTGFETAHVATSALDVGSSGYDEARGRAFYDELKARLLTTAGVTAVSYSRWAPLTGSSSGTRISIEGYRPDPRESRDGELDVNFGTVAPDFFTVFGIPLLEGRAFIASDNSTAPGVAVVNEAFAKQYGRAGSIVGRTLLHDKRSFTVVGVVRNAKYSSLNEPLRPFLYFASAQQWRAGTNLYVRTAGDPAALAAVIRSAVQGIDPLLPAPDVITMDVATSVVLLPQRVAATVTAVLGILGLVLSVVGLYGVVAYTVSQRTREIGLRMALGADRANVLRLILRDGMRLAVMGVAIGMALGVAVTRVMTSFLFGVSPLDPLVFALIPLGLALVALFASYIPARRAAATDPLEALRSQ